VDAGVPAEQRGETALEVGAKEGAADEDEDWGEGVSDLRLLDRADEGGLEVREAGEDELAPRTGGVTEIVEGKLHQSDWIIVSRGPVALADMNGSVNRVT
jgi:hypothetical protein